MRSMALGDTPNIGIDWLTLTFPHSRVNHNLFHELFIKFCARIALGNRGEFLSGGKRNGFDHRMTFMLGVESASYAWGGNMGFAAVELRGSFCKFANVATWRIIKWFAARVKARITRVDIAADYFRGQVDVQALYDLYQDSPGEVLEIKSRAPALGRVDRGNGMTVYLGSMQSAREICIYEKGMQLASKDFPEWVRVELRYRRQTNFEISYDVLSPETWWGYISGLGPFFAALTPDESARAMCYQRKRDEAEFVAIVTRQVRHVRENYGKFIWFMMKLVGEGNTLAALSDSVGEWGKLAKCGNVLGDREKCDMAGSAVLALMGEYELGSKIVQLDQDTPKF